MVLLLLALPLSAAPAEEVAARRFLEESRSVALQVVQEYRAQLMRELQASGPVRALMVCRYSCPEIVSAQARKTGWSVAMVSLKPRNAALAMPDAWQQQVILGFEKRIAKGERAESMEHAEVVTEPQGKFYRYARAIVIDTSCLACHGPIDSMEAALRAQLAASYPFDKATGYRAGQLYGVVTVKRPY
jgi:hypothetical protein